MAPYVWSINDEAWPHVERPVVRELQPLAAGRPHTVLPLASATHITRDPAQQVGLLQVQLDFLRGALDGASGAAPAQ